MSQRPDCVAFFADGKHRTVRLKGGGGGADSRIEDCRGGGFEAQPLLAGGIELPEMGGADPQRVRRDLVRLDIVADVKDRFRSGVQRLESFSRL